MFANKFAKLKYEGLSVCAGFNAQIKMKVEHLQLSYELGALHVIKFTFELTLKAL